MSSDGKFGEKLEELDLSHDEIDRLTKCMKDEKFRDLLRDYAEEISDPENRKRYEEEIAMMERERGNNVKFINPKAGHVLKTSINGKQKCFINICMNEHLGTPSSQPSTQGKTRGMQWSIPHSVSPPREDVDKAGTKCMVYDVVFHPDTYNLLKKNIQFKKMIHDTALDAVERQFDVQLDKVNFRTPKMAYKGIPTSSVIRTPNLNGALEKKDPASLDEIDRKLRPPSPTNETKYSKSNAGLHTASNKAKPKTLAKEGKQSTQLREKGDNDATTTKPVVTELGFVIPEYTITHRGHFDIQLTDAGNLIYLRDEKLRFEAWQEYKIMPLDKDYRVSPDKICNPWPKELVINIDLPLLSKADSVNLEIFKRRLSLDSEKPAKYKLDLKLPYPVVEDKGSAKFDKSRRRLIVTLEVLPAPPPPPGLFSTETPSLVEEIQPSSENKENEPNADTFDEKDNKEEQETFNSRINETSSKSQEDIKDIVPVVVETLEGTETVAGTLVKESIPSSVIDSMHVEKESVEHLIEQETGLVDNVDEEQEGDDQKNHVGDAKEATVLQNVVPVLEETGDMKSEVPNEKVEVKDSDPDLAKKVSFADDVKKNADRIEETELINQHPDSDEDDLPEEIVKHTETQGFAKSPASGALTIGGLNEHDKEVIVDHSTKSAVELSADSLIYELDDCI